MEDKKAKSKWTLMFFFASDNNLSPSMLYQLKSIKTAGYQVDTNVLVHFDPQTRGIPSTIFEVNRMEKKGQKKSKIGDDTNPTVRDLAGDQVQPNITEDGCRCNYSGNYDNLPAEEALTHFLNFSREEYPAEKYMLFLVGHGMVVGRDAFLPDDNPNSGISLGELGKILRNFSRDIGEQEGKLELIGLHSCSMSAVEVAYQLKGTASYMIGSEGLSFVGAWPYRQMLQKIFWTIKNANGAEFDVPDLMKTLHELCLHNGADFIFAGYSSDLCLCSLDPKRVEALSRPIEKLTQALQVGLNDDRGRELIVLAHWKSQSYFQELYTDLFDFCLCLKENCSQSDTNQVQKAMKRACESVIEVLNPKTDEQAKTDAKAVGPIVQVDFVGPDCQYSYGLSIYFPWSRPVEDTREHFIKNYETYAFVTELCGASWLQFLEDYFKKTMRPKRCIQIDPEYQDDLKFARSMFRPIAFRNGQTEYPISALTGKDSPADAGGEFSYSFIKNYSRDFAITERALKVFTDEKGKKKKKK
jgi:hypothetical protein